MTELVAGLTGWCIGVIMGGMIWQLGHKHGRQGKRILCEFCGSDWDGHQCSRCACLYCDRCAGPGSLCAGCTEEADWNGLRKHADEDFSAVPDFHYREESPPPEPPQK